MKEPVGIKQIAKLAEVSIGTVDRVLHNRGGVSKITEQRIRDVVKKTGYKKNTVASRLRLGTHKKVKIAVLIPEATNNWVYWELPKKGMDKAAEELNDHGIEITYFYFSDPLVFISMSRKMLNTPFDGIVTVPFFTPESDRLLRKAMEKEIPVVFLDTRVTFDHPGYFICQNAHQAGLVAGRLLHGLVGGEGIYIVLNIVNAKGLHENSRQRENGFREFFDSGNTKEKIEIYTVNYPLNQPLEVVSGMEKLLKDQRNKGIFVTNSRAYMLPPVFRRYGVTDVPVVGFDLNKENLDCLNRDEISFLINQKPEYQGYNAVKGLFKFLTEKDASELHIDIPVEIVVKENLHGF
ncbi:substrate-binding domain-containing protein [Sinomicrobium sp. M5D2P17]